MLEPGPALAVRSLSRSFGALKALDDVSLVVATGTIHGLLGANGAGKSTLLRSILGLLRPDSGDIELLGHALTSVAVGLPPGVSGMVDLPAFYPHLNARRNLSLLAALDGLADAPGRVTAALEAAGLTLRARDRVGAFSFGMRQRLGMAAALLRAPRLLILDEPTAGLDPAGVRDLRDFLTGFARDGGSVLMSSHDMADVELISDDITILRTGRVVLSESLGELRRRQSGAMFVVRTTDDRRALMLAGGVAVGRTDVGLSVVGESAAIRTWLLALAAEGITPVSLVETGSGLESLFLSLTQSA